MFFEHFGGAVMKYFGVLFLPQFKPLMLKASPCWGLQQPQQHKNKKPSMWYIYYTKTSQKRTCKTVLLRSVAMQVVPSIIPHRTLDSSQVILPSSRPHKVCREWLNNYGWCYSDCLRECQSDVWAQTQEQQQTSLSVVFTFACSDDEPEFHTCSCRRRQPDVWNIGATIAAGL